MRVCGVAVVGFDVCEKCRKNEQPQILVQLDASGVLTWLELADGCEVAIGYE